MVGGDARDVLEKYLATLAERGKPLIRDEVELPYSKDIIKRALKRWLQRTKDAFAREQIKIAYMRLSDFQTLTEEERAAVRAMAKVDLRAKSGSDAYMQRIAEFAKYGEAHKVVAQRSFAECEALNWEINSI